MSADLTVDRRIAEAVALRLEELGLLVPINVQAPGLDLLQELEDVIGRERHR